MSIPVDIEDGVILLEEAKHYTLNIGAHEQAEAWVDGRPLESRSTGVFSIATDHVIGSSNLRIAAAGVTQTWPIRIQPRAEKLPESGWLQLLLDIEEWMPGISVGVSGARHGSVERGGAHAPYLAEALAPLVPMFERALRVMLASPRQETQSRLEDVPIRSARRAGRESLQWMSRHQALSAWLEPWAFAEATGPEPHFPERRSFDALDHPANQYISWLAFRVSEKLREIASELIRLSSDKDSEAARWCGSRGQNLLVASRRIERLWRRSFLRGLTRKPASEAALLVVLGDPIYTRIHRIGRRFLSPMFQFLAEPHENPAAVRPSFHLYELWCFLSVARQFQAVLPNWTWRDYGLRSLMDLKGSGTNAKYQASSGAGVLSIEFNPTFPGYFNRRHKTRWTLSTERRPDIVVVWQPHNDEGAWVCLDAKYRAGGASLGDAFKSVHIYRDALRDTNAGGACRAAFLLAPSSTPEIEDWFSDSFRSEHQCGIWKMRPGGMEESNLARWSVERLGIAT